MNNMAISIQDNDLPGLYQIADSSSVKEQKIYFNGIKLYLILLFVAASFAYFSIAVSNAFYKYVSAVLFLSNVFLLIWLRSRKPDDIWYNGRAVAESVKTRAWRWMMRAEPYNLGSNIENDRICFINDLRTILVQNESLVKKLGLETSIEIPVSSKMQRVRELSLLERFNIYLNERINNQLTWYTRKAKFNKKRTRLLFWFTISFHALAILLLLLNIAEPKYNFPIEAIAVAAASVLTWLQAKKYNELSSSYALAAHEILLIKEEKKSVKTEEEFSEYVLNCENAFSREHTQWYARKNE
jgi:hypothetical protein